MDQHALGRLVEPREDLLGEQVMDRSLRPGQAEDEGLDLARSRRGHRREDELEAGGPAPCSLVDDVEGLGRELVEVQVEQLAYLPAREPQLLRRQLRDRSLRREATDRQ